MDKDFKEFIDSVQESFSEGARAIGVYRFTLEDVITGEKTVQFYKNIIPNAAFTMICNNLTDPTPDNDMLVSHALLGDDNTAVAATDTILGNEVYRNNIASKTNGTAIAYVTAYFNQTEVSGTFYEAGFVSDGTASADTGVLVSHVNINVTKSLTQKLTIDWTLLFANAS